MRNNIPDNQFLGHIGGDDFVISIDDHVDEEYFKSIKVDFEKEVLEYYNHEDLAKGYVETNNRQGDLQKFPLITVTIVSFTRDDYKFNNIFELTKTLSRLKSEKKAKIKKVI